MSANPPPSVHPKILAILFSKMIVFIEAKVLSLLLVQQKDPGGENGSRHPQQPAVATPGHLIIG